ncbi:hypothetical protein Acr_23g0008910 [Actinidia rufa]|uniref:Uncharacterized protein n=1 Tax=Actinidia rufa TaxID=165716 RepID=A0A7J0GNW3_9ERIC|nr:hypothetical protein Acr_23g0008910 [Actinidia rufa]
MVSSLSQKQQSVKLTQEGFEVFREYYPMNEQAVFLDCVWETDKFVLHESVSRSEPEHEDREIGEESVGASLIQYQSIEVLLGDDEFGKTDPNHTTEGLPHVRVDNASSFEDPVLENDDGKQVEDSSNVEEGLGVAGSPSPSENPCSDIGLLTDADSPSCSDPLKLKSGSGKKVAFISVNKPAASTTNLTGLHVTGTKRRRDEREDPLFDLLAGGNLKDSLF